MLPSPQRFDFQNGVQGLHYIILGLALHYLATNKQIWEPTQISNNVQNSQQNNKKVKNCNHVVATKNEDTK